MKPEYIASHLIKVAELLYGKDNKCFAKKKGEHYIFGSKKLNIKNKVDKQVAIYLIIS